MVPVHSYIPFFKPALGAEEEAAAVRVLRSGWLTTGSEAQALEAEFAEFLGVAPGSALAVNSATSGLMLALDALGAGPQGAVLTTPYTFVSTALAAVHLGARVYYADIEKDGFNIDPEAVEAALRIHPDVRVVLPVHIAGKVCRMEDIAAAAEKRGAAVLEDAAHAFPAKTGAGYAGALGDAGVFSFYATKPVTAGEGGMVIVKGEAAARRVSLMRLHGIDRPVWERYTARGASWEYDVTAAGWKCNLPDVLAAIAREQLKKAERSLAERRETARAYSAAFAGEDYLTVPPDGEGNAWHLYIVRVKSGRNEFARRLQEAGIGVSMHFIPHFRFTWLRQHLGVLESGFPNAAARAEEALTLPLWPGMSADERGRVIETVLRVGREYYGGR